MSNTEEDKKNKREKGSDRRTPKGRRSSDRGEDLSEGIEDVSVPNHRRRKTVRRSGEDRRHPK